MLYDITQPLFDSVVFPGDPAPVRTVACDMEKGDLYNLTYLSMCAHNGTHVDAPRHFIRDGKTIDELPLERFVGLCYVATVDGDVTAEEAQSILARAEKAKPGAEKKILIRGKATVTYAAAKVFAAAGTELLGNESQTVGPEDAPMATHLVTLGAGMVLLEGIRLSAVKDGTYFLNCAPVNLNGAEGAPCRAWLMDL